MEWQHNHLASHYGFDWYGVEFAVQLNKITGLWEAYDMRRISDGTGLIKLGAFETLDDAKQFIEVYYKVGA